MQPELAIPCHAAPLDQLPIWVVPVCHCLKHVLKIAPVIHRQGQPSPLLPLLTWMRLLPWPKLSMTSSSPVSAVATLDQLIKVLLHQPYHPRIQACCCMHTSMPPHALASGCHTPPAAQPAVTTNVGVCLACGGGHLGSSMPLVLVKQAPPLFIDVSLVQSTPQPRLACCSLRTRTASQHPTMPSPRQIASWCSV